ncbi:MAG TPA: D-alanyl-D-alanine carboxypeptidase, partial [Pyrinomonadaceae bacterium]|nr:D-alanyl-D-alanine carboxypeptidase [Pyrinomonadaceae bacterium]
MFRAKFYQGLIHIFGLFALILASPLALYAQTTQTEQTAPDLTRPTVLSRPAPASSTALPSVDDSAIPYVGMTGVLVETLEGKPVMEQLGNIAFNPASAVKLATALAALRTFG